VEERSSFLTCAQVTILADHQWTYVQTQVSHLYPFFLSHTFRQIYFCILLWRRITSTSSIPVDVTGESAKTKALKIFDFFLNHSTKTAQFLLAAQLLMCSWRLDSSAESDVLPIDESREREWDGLWAKLYERVFSEDDENAVYILRTGER
jgi:hypothetical protein